MLENPAELDGCRQALLELRHKLGGPGASGRVADIAAGMLGLSAPSDPVSRNGTKKTPHEKRS
jgi:hypothetical protein